MWHKDRSAGETDRSTTNHNKNWPDRSMHVDSLVEPIKRSPNTRTLCQACGIDKSDIMLSVRKSQGLLAEILSQGFTGIAMLFLRDSVARHVLVKNQVFQVSFVIIPRQGNGSSGNAGACAKVS